MRLLILGANSDIALAIARQFAEAEGAEILLASRDTERLEKRAADLRTRYSVPAQALYFDACDTASHRTFYEGLGDGPDVVVTAFGLYAEQETLQRDFERARQVIEANYVGAVSILEIAAADFERRGHGTIIGISSVAGDRGRQSNYIYGSAKAGMSVFLAGLRNRLHHSGGRVITVLPGYVRTKMTEALDLPALLTAEPAQVAGDVHRAFRKGTDILYTRWFWRWIMFLIRMTPETVFKRLRL